jgi:hypothetical protein
MSEPIKPIKEPMLDVVKPAVKAPEATKTEPVKLTLNTHEKNPSDWIIENTDTEGVRSYRHNTTGKSFTGSKVDFKSLME